MGFLSKVAHFLRGGERSDESREAEARLDEQRRQAMLNGRNKGRF